MRAAAVGLLVIAWVGSAQQPKPVPETQFPETVMVTFRAKAGAEAELAAVIARHWTTSNSLGLFETSPHLTLRGSDGEKKTWFVEIFTWRDASIPDHAPPAIQAIWEDMNRLTEARGGKPGLEFATVSVVPAAALPPGR